MRAILCYNWVVYLSKRAGNGMSPDDRPSASLTAEELLQRGIAAAREERHGEARRCLQQVLALDSSNEEAWLWLANITPDPRSALAYFSQVLDINPQNQRARDGFVAARAQLAERDKSSPASSANERGSATLSPPAPRFSFRMGRIFPFGLIALAL